MRMFIGGEIFNLRVDDDRWREHLEDKYRNFLVKEGEAKFEVEVMSEEGNGFEVEFKKDYSCALIKTPASIESFFDFNFFFKTVVSALFLDEGCFLIHASSLEIDGKGFLFAGKTGSGKSTIAKKLRRKGRVLSDDFALVKRRRGEYYVFSSPFYETEEFKKRRLKVLVERVYFIKQDEKVRVEEVGKEEALLKVVSLILTPLSLPSLNEKNKRYFVERAWKAGEEFVSGVDFSLLYFNLEKDLWEKIRES